MAVNVIDMMDTEMKKAAQKGTGAPTFFVLKSGEKALVRPLLDLSQAVVIHKHDFFNPATKKYEVNALCAADMPDLQQQCQICLDAEKNKKLKAVLFFIVPVYVYRVINVQTGNPVTYTDQTTNEEVEISGVRYMQLKASSPILATFLSFFREEGSILNNDFVIERKGDSLDTTYTVIAKQPKPFAPPVQIPVQEQESILFRIADVCPPKFVGDEDPFASVPAATPAVSSSNGNGKVRNVPEF